MKELIADYMEQGFLDNILALFRQDSKLYALIGDLLQDERSRVRIGIVALVESLRNEAYEQIVRVIPGIAAALEHPNPTIRGDAAYLLGIIGDRSALPFLRSSVDDENLQVREAVRESMEEISGRDEETL